ncbi:MAG: ComEA family DNA-binding protein [Chloroflexi bacterium]|nr:ComEA family DNA-binding protein [Chloroflexota bacterium]
MAGGKTEWGWGLVGVAAGLLGAGILAVANAAPRGAAVSLAAAPSPAPMFIQVSGAVAAPDVYALPPGSRARDAIAAAGGLLPEARADDLNLAAPLSDGQKINVPFQPTATPEGYVPPTPAGQATATLEVTFPIDLNTATLEELMALPGIGPTRAQAILDYRAEHGPFTRIEQIMNVPGIGPGIFEDIRELITVGP